MSLDVLCGDDWVVVPKVSALTRTLSKGLDKKDVKYVPSTVSQKPLSAQSDMLPSRLLRSGPASVAPISTAARMGDDKDDGPPTPPTPPSPSSSSVPVDPRQKLQKLCRFDISKFDPTDPVIREELTKLASFGFGRGLGGFKPALKHQFTSTAAGGTQLGFLVNDGKGNAPFPAPVSTDISNFSRLTKSGWSLPGYIFTGDGLTNRLGRTIRPIHCTMRIDLNWAYNTTAVQVLSEGWGSIRMIVIRDKMAISSLPTNAPASSSIEDGAAVFMTTQPGATPSDQQNMLIAQWNPVTHGYRYEVLHDEVFTAAHNGVSVFSVSSGGFLGCATAHHVRHLDCSKWGLITYGDDAASGNTFIIKNDIFIMWAVDLTMNGSTLAYPYVDWAMDLSFVDN